MNPARVFLAPLLLKSGLMTGRRFEWALRARGPVLADWPARERAQAVWLLRHCPAARQALADALAAEDAPSFDTVALARVTCRVRRALAPPKPVMRALRWGALAACLGSGLYIGLQPGDGASDTVPEVHASMPATVLAALEP